MAIDAWAKYGSIKNGLIDAHFTMTDEQIIYANCYQAFNTEPIGDKFNVGLQAAIAGNQLCATWNGLAIGYLPITWTKFVHEVAQRGPIDGTGSIRWDNGAFKISLTISEQ